MDIIPGRYYILYTCGISVLQTISPALKVKVFLLYRDNEEEEEENIPKLNSFFKRVKKQTEIPRHRFYHEQGLTSLTEI